MNAGRHNRIIYALMLFLFLVIPGAAHSEELTFEDALKITGATHESITAAQMEQKQREQEKLAAQGLYLPTIRIHGRYTRIDDPVSIDLNDMRTVISALHPAVPSSMIPSFEMTLQDDAYREGSIDATWPLFTGGRITAANRAAEATVREAKEKVRGKEYATISDLTRYYFGLRLARQVVDVRLEVLKGMERHLFQARKMEEHGIISRAERLHAEVAFSEADREFKKAVRERDLAQTALNNILSSATPVDPVSPLFIFGTIEPLAIFRSRAAENNPALKQLDATIDRAHQGYEKEKGAYFPEVYLFGTRALFENDLTALQPEWAVGIGVNFTLFDGMARRRHVTASQYREKEISLLGKRARKDVDTLVEQNYHELMKAREQYEALETSCSSAEEYLRVRTRAFNEGFASSLDVVDAEMALSRVRIERLRAMYDFDVALARLLEVSGGSEKFDQYRMRSAKGKTDCEEKS